MRQVSSQSDASVSGQPRFDVTVGTHESIIPIVLTQAEQVLRVPMDRIESLTVTAFDKRHVARIIASDEDASIASTVCDIEIPEVIVRSVVIWQVEAVFKPSRVGGSTSGHMISMRVNVRGGMIGECMH